jgi:hypothetical protein
MNLKTICMDNLVIEIKNLPLQIKEDLLDVSLNQIKKEIIKDICLLSVEIINELTRSLILSKQRYEKWNPPHRPDIDLTLYKTYISIAEIFVMNYNVELDIDIHANKRMRLFRQDISSDEDSSFSDN